MEANSHEDWVKIHQPYELAYHKQGNFRWREELWQDQWNKVFRELMGFVPEQFNNGEQILDLGCGSRPCLDWFTGNYFSFHLDPLLADYLKIEQMKQYWCRKSDDHLLSMPAEELYDPLVGECDYVHCWNVLDHVYNWRDVWRNFVKYCKVGGVALLGTDLGRRPSKGHPGIDEPDELRASVEKHFEIVNEISPFVYRKMAVKLIRKAIPYG